MRDRDNRASADAFRRNFANNSVYEWGTLRDRKRTDRHVATLHRTSILVRRRFSTRTRRVVGAAIGKMRWEEKLVQVVNSLYSQPWIYRTLRTRYAAYAVTRLLGIDICRANTRKFESNALVLLHLHLEPPFNVSGREWDISLLLLSRGSSGSIIYGRIFEHRDHTCACFTRPLKILLSGDDFFDSDSPILMSGSITIDLIHNTRRKEKHEGSKSMNNKSLRNYSIIIWNT